MSYERFAYLYDELMKDVPYEKWVEIVTREVQKLGIDGKQLLDLACGTGELSVQFAEGGFEVTGVDLSEDMLAVAFAKAQDRGLELNFYQQNMAELELMTPFDIVGIFCDSLNYLQTEEDVIKTFHSVFRHLKENGLFIFDVHSVHKMSNLFLNQTYAYNGDDISYIWQCFEGEFPLSIEHELTFFVQDDDGKYDRYDELHFQRTYPVQQYIEWLEKAGLQVMEILADFENKSYEQDCERILFIAKK
ncbi:class I SAM-dependent DNA methyltransferase [Bacillus massilinigeriensis]|uniref:class I SAM-dependent DNA methyltransferase n=1 Tax=Bacillus massilionigeriensis TaxID=1805475 RepID=UPI00096B2ECB|nr:class I SAM-dependent methyltransferase [Bacillus massilionigeriensis]